jgi:hypothetical protein
VSPAPRADGTPGAVVRVCSGLGIPGRLDPGRPGLVAAERIYGIFFARAEPQARRTRPAGTPCNGGRQDRQARPAACRPLAFWSGHEPRPSGATGRQDRHPAPGGTVTGVTAIRRFSESAAGM